jgi:3D (Asp-Asp-Asp) domain-containing protein
VFRRIKIFLGFMKGFYSAAIVVVLIGGAIGEVLSRSNAEQNGPLADATHCSEGWRITGYFTPIEMDYDSGQMTEIEVGRWGKMSFDSEFLRTVFDGDEGFGEGWGKTRFGWYLGNYNGTWHKADAPLDANNSPLRTNSIAVDNSLIPNDSAVTIPGLPDEFGKTDFVANDVGVTVRGKHIDVYTGEGKEAQREMYRVTFEDDNELQRVCFEMPEEQQ